METVIRYSGWRPRPLEARDARALLSRALRPSGGRVHKACLYIEDVNGPRGGADKQGRCVLHVDRMRPVVVRGRAASVSELVQGVANRAARVLRDRVARRKSKRRRQRSRAPQHEAE